MFKFVKEIPLYPNKFAICITKDLITDGKYFGITFDNSDIDCKARACKGSVKGKKVVVIFIYPEYIESWGLWAHECLHCVNYLFEYIGIPADNVNDEAHAYLLTWMMNEAQKFLEKNKKDIKEFYNK